MASGSRKRLTHDAYTVALICPLEVELSAVRYMLDEEHERLAPAQGDTNMYILGQLSGHNVVIASLPAGFQGKASAATVAPHVTRTFPAIKLRLLVGIGGGVPSQKIDIRLGDVVVSMPSGTHGGVVQYDLGKRTAHYEPEKQAFEGVVRKGFLCHPPVEWLVVLPQMQSDHRVKSHRISEFVSEMLTKYPKLVAYKRPAPDTDLLFQSDYLHDPDKDTCQECDRTRVVIRPDRDTPDHPTIHYGLIASGDTIMKDASMRENISKASEGAICFEMEAAGLMNDFHCIVVRGISDYADSHKNDIWHAYAAAAAAGLAKEMLSYIYPPGGDQKDSEKTKSSELVQSNEPSRFRELMKRPEWRVELKETSTFNIFENISDYEPDLTHQSYIRQICPGTAGWVRSDERLVLWNGMESHPCLWLSGIIGSGKTIITSAVVQYLMEQSKETGGFVAHFFYSHSHSFRLEAAHLFRSYIKQALGFLDMTGVLCPPDIALVTKRLFGPNRYSPTFEDMIDGIFLPLSQFLLKHVTNITYMVDGLDECREVEVRKVLKTFSALLYLRGVKIFISGRESLDVSRFIPGSTTFLISQDHSRNDIRNFISWKIGEKMKERQLTDNEDVIEEIQSKLNTKADLMILWVNLQLEALWDECSTDAEIREALENLPEDLNETYRRCLMRINKRQSRFAIKVLHWVCVTPKPFKVNQLREAVAVDRESGKLNKDGLPSADEILKCCANLLTRGLNDQVLLAHHSVRQYLESKRAVYQPSHLSTGRLQLAELELGELCVSHLMCSDYMLNVQVFDPNRGSKITMQTPAVQKLTETIPPWMRPFLPKPKSTHVLLPKRTAKIPFQAVAGFFTFAKEQWAPLTRRIKKDSSSWDKFRRLALEPNWTWRWHPWIALGISIHSHYCGLLGWAVANSHKPLLELLLDSPTPKPRPDIFNLPLQQYNNLPALHLAARSGDVEIVQLILSQCDPKKEDDDGRTALHHAAEAGFPEIVLVLGEKISVNQADLVGQTCLHLGARTRDVEVIKAIVNLKAGSNQNIFRRVSSEEWKNAIHLAVEWGHLEAVSLMLDLGVPVDSRNVLGQTPLHVAAEHGSLQILQVLCEHEASINYRNRDGKTALQKAAEDGYSQVVQLLCEHRASINCRDRDGQTALHKAAEKGHLRVVQLLQEYGALVDHEDHHKQTALQLAAENNHREILTFLLDRTVKRALTPVS